MIHPEQWQAYAAWQQSRGQRWPLPATSPVFTSMANADTSHTEMPTAPGPANTMDPLTELGRKISLCRACANWSQGHSSWGQDQLAAIVMFIGDHPHHGGDGKDPALFSPECFEMLRRITQALRLRPEQAFYTNLVMCPPPASGRLSMESVLSCREHLISLLRLVKPRLIITLGAEASASLSGQSGAFSNMVGKWFSHPAFPQTRFMPVYHPRDMLAQAELKKVTWQALQEAMAAVSLS